MIFIVRPNVQPSTEYSMAALASTLCPHAYRCFCRQDCHVNPASLRRSFFGVVSLFSTCEKIVGGVKKKRSCAPKTDGYTSNYIGPLRIFGCRAATETQKSRSSVGKRQSPFRQQILSKDRKSQLQRSLPMLSEAIPNSNLSIA